MASTYMVMWKNNDVTGLHGLVSRAELQGVRSRMEGEMRWDPRDVLEEEWFGRDRTKDKEGKGKGEEEEKEEKGKEEDEEDTKA